VETGLCDPTLLQGGGLLATKEKQRSFLEEVA
jgi:hypothetical protein